VSSVFQVSIGIVYIVWHILDSIFIAFDTSKKSLRNWVKKTIFIHF